MTTFYEEICSRLNLDWSDISNNDLYTETELTQWLTFAKNEVMARYSWPFTEGREEIASVSGQEKYDYPTNVKSDSIRYLTINDKRYQKLLFEDYLKYREDYDSGSKKFFSDRNRILYVNYLADDFGNSIVVYGQVEVTGAIDSTTSTSVFTQAEPEGDTIIVDLAYARALSSEKEQDLVKARSVKNEALQQLDEIWNRIAERQYTYQTKDTAMFERLDVLNGGMYEDEIKRNQF